MPAPRVIVRNSVRNPMSPRPGRGSPAGPGRRRAPSGQLALAPGDELGDGAEVLGGHVHRQLLERLVQLAVDRAGDDLRPADGQLEALAAHRLDEHGQRELAAALHLPGVGALGGQHAQRRRCRRARRRAGPFTSRAVSFVPGCGSRPASGEVLMPMVTAIAGSSTRMRGQRHRVARGRRGCRRW